MIVRVLGYVTVVGFREGVFGIEFFRVGDDVRSRVCRVEGIKVRGLI